MKAVFVFKLRPRASAWPEEKVSFLVISVLAPFWSCRGHHPAVGTFDSDSYLADNHMINGTKLLNVAGMTRGRRDGILKSEKLRKVVKIGPMHLKGVWYAVLLLPSHSADKLRKTKQLRE